MNTGLKRYSSELTNAIIRPVSAAARRNIYIQRGIRAISDRSLAFRSKDFSQTFIQEFSQKNEST
ncbi:hypothetical protein A3780_21020 [Kosakonia radicincitans]|nr:hypothetical protein A3780_21020 [Kosakonia radicincitans]KDE33920.1 hypothetical protein AW40_25095 [Kosakonia radicincitans UMEnt01/12]PTA89611.1 hypothetical protein CWM66_17415 [Kosakonia sp. H7A]